MEKIRIEYLGDLQTRITHQRSNTQLVTDAPVDNHGQGRSFSPTDLLCSATASCMLTIIGLAAQTSGFSIEGCKLTATKEMASEPRRVGAIYIDLDFRTCHLDAKQRLIVERSAKTCPVMQSLNQDMKKELNFIYE